MIVTRLSGGLGNQMFQYAAGRALADRLGVELLLDTRALQHTLALQAYTRRDYALGRFRLRARLATPADLEAWPKWVAELGLRLPVVRPIFRRWQFESSITYDPGIQTLGDPAYLVGYWQSERYFSAVAEPIRADFTLKEPLGGANATLQGRALAEGSVGLHVRRGDFADLSAAAKVHGLCTLDYYRRAICKILERVPECHYLVFSDDPEWARAELPLGTSAVFVNGNAGAPEWDLMLMSACRHHIIANSSFSWWGAWLGHKPDQVVIAPTPWYARSKLDDRDLAVSRWQYISRV